MKKSLPMVRMCWGMMNELLNKATGERERVQVRRK